MKAFVLVKEVPSSAASVSIGEGQSLDWKDKKPMISPYDEHAVEAALQLKEQQVVSEVVICCLGPESQKETMLKALAMGADKGILVVSTQEYSSLVTSMILAAVIKKETCNVVLCGRHGIDHDNGHIPAMLGALLDWPHIGPIRELSYLKEKNGYLTKRTISQGQAEEATIIMPCILAVDKTLNKPRYAKVPDILKAKKKPIDLIQISDLGLNDLDSFDFIDIQSYTLPPQKSAGQIFQGEDVKSMVTQVVTLLKDEARVL